MRTKTLLLTAALAAIGASSSMAQVYSVNAVGYINLSLPKGFSIIANQLNASPDNKVSTVFGNPAGPVTLYTYRNATGDFGINSYDTDFAQWDNPDQIVGPGTGIFALNGGSTSLNFTFVGEVPQGTLSTPMNSGYNLVASQVPQSGLLQTDLKYVPAPTGDVVYRYNNASKSYQIFNYDPDFADWDTQPSVNVGEGVFIFRNGGGAATWTRTFTVN